MPSSIYAQCSEAARELLDDPHKRIATRCSEEIFTELDVIFLAAREAGGYNPEMMKVAQREASQVMGTMFRANQVVRFGPVHVPGLAKPDYMRVASKIAYAHPDGPGMITTPNGVFPRMCAEDDAITQQGRRLGANRNDLELWEDQAILVGGSAKPTDAQQRELARLRSELDAVLRRAESAEAELHRLRERAASMVTREEIQELIAQELANRGGSPAPPSAA